MEKENRFSEVAIEKKKRINFFWQAIHGSCNGMFVIEKLKTLISRCIYMYICKKKGCFSTDETHMNMLKVKISTILNTLKCYKWIVEMHKNTFTWLCIVHSTF